MADIPTDKPVVDPAIKEREKEMIETDLKKVVKSNFSGDNSFHSAIPDVYLNMFFKLLSNNKVKTKRYYAYDDLSQKYVKTRYTKEDNVLDAKTILALFAKMYPEHFDKLSGAKINKLTKDSGDSGEDDLLKLARTILKYPGQKD